MTSAAPTRASRPAKRPLASIPPGNHRRRATAERGSDAARDEHAVPRSVKQRRVAGECAQHGTEYLDAAHAGPFLATGGAGGDVFGSERRHRLAGDLAQRCVDVDQARPAQQTFPRNAPVAAAQTFEDRDLFGVAGGELRARLGLQDERATLAHRDGRDAKAGSRSDTAYVRWSVPVSGARRAPAGASPLGRVPAARGRPQRSR